MSYRQKVIELSENYDTMMEQIAPYECIPSVPEAVLDAFAAALPSGLELEVAFASPGRRHFVDAGFDAACAEIPRAILVVIPNKSGCKKC